MLSLLAPAFLRFRLALDGSACYRLSLLGTAQGARYGGPLPAFVQVLPLLHGMK